MLPPENFFFFFSAKWSLVKAKKSHKVSGSGSYHKPFRNNPPPLPSRLRRVKTNASHGFLNVCLKDFLVNVTAGFGEALKGKLHFLCSSEKLVIYFASRLISIWHKPWSDMG